VIVFDALRVRIRDEGTVRAKAVYLALGIAPDGTKDVLGLWIEQTEGAKFLAPGDDRAEEPGRGGRPGGGSRRALRPPRDDHHRLPSGDGADLHRAPAALLARLRHLAAS
jgi:hypothetical protein